MATTQKPKAKSSGPKRYFLVNPAGAVHEVPYDLAKVRLRELGYRMATSGEVKEFNNRKGRQLWDSPIAARWDPQPEPEVEPEAHGGDN